MELRHLRYFAAVAEAQNVTRASQKLHVAQPAVSRQIRDLEEELGVALLERGAKSVRLTDAGRVFLDEARAVLERADSAVAKVRAFAGDGHGELHVGYAPSLTAKILPRALRAVQAKFPGARVLLHDLSTEEMLAGLHAGRLQVALLVQPTPAQRRGLHFRCLVEYPMCVAVAPGHPLARRRSVAIAKIPQPLVTYSKADYPEAHEALAEMFASTGRAPVIAEEHDSATSLIAAIESGRGVAVVPDSLACIAGPRLKLVPITPAPAPLRVGAMWRGARLTAAAEYFIESAAGQKESA